MTIIIEVSKDGSRRRRPNGSRRRRPQRPRFYDDYSDEEFEDDYNFEDDYADESPKSDKNAQVCCDCIKKD